MPTRVEWAGKDARQTQAVYPQGNISRKRGIPQGCVLTPFGGWFIQD
ncbi:hypothetical protein [Yersinia frederiksenii]|nr:hypothetical protein [Yersinia frederiksenii]